MVKFFCYCKYVEILKGVSWPATFALYLIDLLSFKRCEAKDQFIFKNITELIATNTCSQELEIEVTIETLCKTYIITNYRKSSLSLLKTCIRYGAQCVVFIDAFYYLTGVLVAFGIGWLLYYSKVMLHLQELKKSYWRIGSSDIKSTKSIIL